MGEEEEKLVKDKVLIDYADAKKTLAVLLEEAHQIGKEFFGLAEMLKSHQQVRNISLDYYQKFLSKEYYDVIEHLRRDIPEVELELGRLSDRMRQIGYAHML